MGCPVLDCNPDDYCVFGTQCVPKIWLPYGLLGFVVIITLMRRKSEK